VQEISPEKETLLNNVNLSRATTTRRVEYIIIDSIKKQSCPCAWLSTMPWRRIGVEVWRHVFRPRN